LNEKEPCELRAKIITEKLAQKINQWAVDELIDEKLIMQGMVWQNLASWLIAGAIKMARKEGFSVERIGCIIQDLLNAGFEMERIMREPMEITNEKPEKSELN
jgi:hypothetical protein